MCFVLFLTTVSERIFPLLRRQKALEEEERERKKEERLRRREQKLREREERKNLKKLRRQQEEEQKKLQMKIAMEERRLLLAQRNLESIRLIAELLARAKVEYHCHLQALPLNIVTGVSRKISSHKEEKLLCL